MERVDRMIGCFFISFCVLLIFIAALAGGDSTRRDSVCYWQPKTPLELIGKITSYVPVKVACFLTWDWSE